MKLPATAALSALGALTLILAGCSSGSPSASSTSSSTAQAAGHKGGTFTILANSAFGVADPAQNYTLEEWQLLIDTHDGLVGFAKVGGVAGSKIVPDLATSIPTPTNGGKTYLFHIRQGIKFSNGQTLKPSDFVRTFERQFTVPGPTSFYSGLVGASKCSTKGCDLSQGVVADDTAYTLTLNLTAPDPELMDQLSLPFAYAVPANTSLKLTGNNVAPGTGPYMWKSYNPNTQAVLVRNPYFHVWNAEAQPEGYPNEIIEKYGLPGLRRGASGAERPGQRGLRRRPDPLRPAQPAEQPEVRQPGAREHADRRLVLRAEHQAPAVQQPAGPAGHQLRGQPGGLRQDRGRFLAGRADLPDPAAELPLLHALLPVHGGTWSQHVDRARPGQGQAAGPAVRHGRDEGGRQRHQRPGRQGAGRADDLGPGRDRLQARPRSCCRCSVQYPFVQNSSNSGKWNVGWSAWYQDYPAQSDFLNVLLGCGTIHPNSDASPNIAAFCDQSIEAKINQAESMEATDPTGAAKLWAQIDHAETDAAPWVDMYNPKQIDFLSSNVHGYSWNPQWYILIDRLWLS